MNPGVSGALAHGGESHAPADQLPVPALVAIAVATVGGAWLGGWLARRSGGSGLGPPVIFAVAAGVLFAVATAHLLPEALAGATSHGTPPRGRPGFPGTARRGPHPGCGRDRGDARRLTAPS
jgi:hypothetical protein